MTEGTNTKKSSALSKINLFLIVLIAIYLFIHERAHQSLSQFIIESIYSTTVQQQPVDFSVSNIQPLSDGFMLSKASQEKHLTGIKFKGRIINTQSVNHRNVTFSLSVNGKEKEFTINKISSGNSTGFNVYLPDLMAEDARYANIKYISSLVEYHTK